MIGNFNQTFYDLINKAYTSNLISKHLWKFMLNEHPKLATFYCLPKTHKGINKITEDLLYFGSKALQRGPVDLLTHG